MNKDSLFIVRDTDSMSAFNAWAQSAAIRGKPIEDSMRKACKYWVSFAMAKIPKTSRQKITGDLTRIITTYSKLPAAGKKRKSSKAADAMRGTLAATLVRVLNWRGAADKSLKGTAFYSKARAFVGTSASSANFHRAGLTPSLLALKGSRSGLPRLKSPPGSHAEKVQEIAASILMENYALAKSKGSAGIAKLAPDAFDKAIQEVDAMLAKFLQQDNEKAAAKAGFTVS